MMVLKPLAVNKMSLAVVTPPAAFKDIVVPEKFSNDAIFHYIKFVNAPANELNILSDYAPGASWQSGQVQANGSIINSQALPWMGSDGSSNGFVISSYSKMEDNAPYTVLRTHPMWCNYGMISGRMALNISGNGTFKAKVGFLAGASGSDGVTFSVNVLHTVNGASATENIITQNKRYSGELAAISADLSKWVNQDIQLELRVDAGASSGQDWAAWVNPVIDIQPQAAPNSTYTLVTNKFNTSDLGGFGIGNVYQKTTLPNTFLIVPASYGISLKDGRPCTYLENIIIMEDTSTDKSSATLSLGLAPRISEFQLMGFKTLLKKTFNVRDKVSLEYPAGSDTKLASPAGFTLFKNVSLTYNAQPDGSQHFQLVFSDLGLNDMAGFIKLLDNSSYSIAVSLSVNAPNDEQSVLDLALVKENITGAAVTASPGTLNITLTNAVNSAVHLKSMIIEDSTKVYDLSALNAPLLKLGDTYDLSFIDLLGGSKNISSNPLADLLGLNLQNIMQSLGSSYSNIQQGEFAFDYDVDYDEKKILDVNYTEADSNQSCLTVSCPAPNDLTLSGSKDFFDVYHIDTMLVTFGSDHQKVIVPRQIPFTQDAPRYQMVFAITKVGGDLTDKNLSYQVTVKFKNGQPDLIQPSKTLDLSAGNILQLDGPALGLGSPS